MLNHSFTDEQLLNFVNNTITSKTEFDIKDFTGGSVQLTSTNNHQLIKYKVSLFFGYKNRNPISRTFDITEDLVYIWQCALLTKIKSLQTSNNGMNYSEMNVLMNSPSKVVSNKVVSISKGSNAVVRPSYEHHQEDKIRPIDCINLYKEKITSDFAYVREQTSYTQLAIKENELDNIYLGIENFANSNNGLKYTLPNFIKDGIYKDYQNVKVSQKDGNIVIPKNLIGIDFYDDNEKYQFRENGVYSYTKDTVYTGQQTIKSKIEVYNSSNDLNFDMSNIRINK